MTPEQQRIALAEWAGEENHPDYLNNLNAVHELETRLPKEQFQAYLDWLDVSCGGELELSAMIDGPEFVFAIAHATAAQRCEAILKTLNLWKGGEV